MRVEVANSTPDYSQQASIRVGGNLCFDAEGIAAETG